MLREGSNAIIFSHSCVFGLSRRPVRSWWVSDVKPYAQYQRSITIGFIEPRKRNGRSFVAKDGDRAPTFYTVEQDGLILYNSRSDIAVDMEEWQATAARFKKEPAIRINGKPAAGWE
jgi:hypothetical protein